MTRPKVEAERPSSIRAKEDLNRFVLAAHELGRLRVQTQEIGKSNEGLGVSLLTPVAFMLANTVRPVVRGRGCALLKYLRIDRRP